MRLRVICLLALFSIIATISSVYAAEYDFGHYLHVHQDASRPAVEVIIEAGAFTRSYGQDVRNYINHNEMPGTSVWTDETGVIEWEVYIEEAGLYNISVLFFSTPGKSSDIQRTLTINGEVPFAEALSLEFHRTWINREDVIRQDARGNDVRPTQIEQHRWSEITLRDALGAYNNYLLFYFSEGLNTIALHSLREPMIIRQIRLHQVPEAQSYASVSADRSDLPTPSLADVAPIRIEGEAATRKSSPMLSPQSDMSGTGVYPYSARYIRMNHIGGTSWSTPGSWIEWDVYVPQAGLYHIALNVLQNFHRGSSSFRRILINGQVPFQEMEAVAFGFERGWRVEMLGGEETPFLFYLEEGINTIRMEAVLGDYAQYTRLVQESVLNLNSLYRQIIMITGTNPDRWRDYQIDRRLPNLQSELIAERERLEYVFGAVQDMASGRGERNTVLRSLHRMLTLMYEDIENVPSRLNRFREHVGGAGTWLMLVREQMLAVDAIYILPYDSEIPDNGRRWWRQIWHEILTFIFSFFIDYNTIGSSEEAERHIEVWVGTGRDQASVIKQMIDEHFTAHTGIGVTLMLVDIGTLLPATVAGQGPDVALSVGNSLPMDFGMRRAVADISGMPGFAEVTERFVPAAMIPYTFEDRVFALPETITFPMLFYRRDVLEEIGIAVPNTWGEVRVAISELSMHNMDFGLPAGEFPHFPYFMFLFQMGGQVYNDSGTASALDTPEALNAFREYTRFYLEYNLDREFDFANRFRMGEMPIAIADYTVYNMLQVFAPEIRGQWGFTQVPGTVREDGSINRAVPAGGTAIVMMEAAEDKLAAWEFMKWWTSAEAQTLFGREMESLMGAAARHPTANMEAFSMLPWPVADYRAIAQQFEYVQGIPEVPGGYFTPRQVRNAFFTTVELRNVGAREALSRFVRLINDEITAKRNEFGLD